MTTELSAPQQEALWWIQQRSPRKDIYNLTWRLSVGALESAALERAWRTVVNRHEALRTALVQRDGAVWQEVATDVRAELAELVFQPYAQAGLPAGTDLFDLVARYAHRSPFDLERAPLARLTLVTAGDRSELLLTVHHAALDGWSLQRVVEELATAYNAELHEPGSGASSFDTEPVPSSEYTRAARRALADGEWRDSVDYWVDRLDGPRPAHCATLMPDHVPAADPGTPGSDGAVLRHRLSAAASAGVRGLTERGGMTAIAAYLAAVYVVLARGGAGPEVAVGVAVANRMSERDERCVGYLTNVVLATGVVDDTDTLDGIVERARDDFWDSLAHQRVPFSIVHNALPTRARERIGDLPAVLMTYHGDIGVGVWLGDQVTELLESPSTGATNDLSLGVFEQAGGTIVEVEYDTTRFESRTVRRLLADLDRVLAAGVVAGASVQSIAVDSHTAPTHLVRALAAVSALGAELPVATSAVDLSVAAMPGADETPAGSVQAIVAELWRRELRVADPAGAAGDFFTQGGHSLQVFGLMAEIQEHTGGQVDIMEWLDRPTLGRLVELVEASVAREPTSGGGSALLRTGADDGAHLYLIHGAGGADQSTYRDLIAALPPSWRITVSPDDRGETIAAMADIHVAALLSQPRLPDVIGGWSLGGLLAYAIALQLRRQGIVPPRLLVIDPPPPESRAIEDDESDLDAFVGTILRGARAEHLLPQRVRLSDDDAEHGLGVLLGLLHAHGASLTIDALRHRFRAIRRHWQAMSSYASREPVAVPAVLVVAELDDADVAKWLALFGKDNIVVNVDADHYAAAKDPHARDIADWMVKLVESTSDIVSAARGR